MKVTLDILDILDSITWGGPEENTSPKQWVAIDPWPVEIIAVSYHVFRVHINPISIIKCFFFQSDAVTGVDLKSPSGLKRRAPVARSNYSHGRLRVILETGSPRLSGRLCAVGNSDPDPVIAPSTMRPRLLEMYVADKSFPQVERLST